MATNEPITGHVIAIFDEREVLIDRGIEHGVEIGMRFVILGDEQQIEVPGADATIPIRRPKTEVKIVRLEGKIASVGRTFRTIKGSPGLAALMQGTPSIGPIPDRLETFKYDQQDRIVDNTDKVVRRGDPVRQTTGDEYFD